NGLLRQRITERWCRLRSRTHGRELPGVSERQSLELHQIRLRSDARSYVELYLQLAEGQQDRSKSCCPPCLGQLGGVGYHLVRQRPAQQHLDEPLRQRRPDRRRRRRPRSLSREPHHFARSARLRSVLQPECVRPSRQG